MSLPKLVKRRPYIDYSQFQDKIPAILNRLINTKRGDITKVQNETGIPYSTLSRWHQQLCKNTRFNPLDRKWGQSKRIFTDAEEDSIADYITQNYILKGLHFTDEDFKEIAMKAHDEKYFHFLNSDDLNGRKKYKEFHCSAGFIADFKYHHGFSSKVFHAKRRSNPNNEVEKKFLADMSNLFATVDHELIINVDETGWRLFPKGILTWGQTGRYNTSRGYFNNCCKSQTCRSN